ncbi:MAG: peptidoglycan DD-metalloendopeptidase family protein [Gammaproteobacteria bacterium]|nr:peptidoglycan DD-metalloendopeptidase family protein [Gammaproteobacteria bacterium]MBT8094499.1 peptidoglycan DD-metalloendopeptidase family protein [Gammaproteobacteria bacterium]MBT8105044.1 peptidoglycan DD-metalloendopeptidase family protein [Gammaproteobacteria bacterium]NNK25058.1 peptidoglycan DD-metalloendopeptidase family protein [Woeseiaceae bacterium]NNL64066.1 peptidoglycan DD-metalloendopeptidase family protein [Woeseiaceae bacterium]
MNRPASPLLHDYKPSAAKKTAKSRAIYWFAVGLGIPLLAVALLRGLVSDESHPIAPSEPIATAPDAVPLPVDEAMPVSIDLASLGPLPALPPEPEYERLTLTVRRGDTMEKLFRKHDLDIGHLLAIARLDEAKARFRRLKPGDVFEVEHDDGKIVSLYSELDLTSALQIRGGDDGFAAEIVDRAVEIRKRLAYGVIESSLFESAAQAGLTDKTVMNVAGIFAWDIDFILDIRHGDNYYVLFEEIWQDGEYVTDGEIIAAEFNNNGRQFQAIRFKDGDKRSDYFTPTGDSVRKAFIRAPVDFTRISSNFNPNRRHPILNTIRAHRGVDYAAPRGTPIKAAGDGKVIFRGTKSGYGKVVILQHGGNITTLYAHMSNFAAKARLGSRVRQGQTIGYVGMTGLATANHLHYEYRLNGVHRNPRTVSLPHAEPIATEYREKFLAQAGPILEELENYKRTRLAAIAFNTQ